MRLAIRVQPNARNEKVEKISEREYRVWVKTPAKEGKANEALIRVLADYFNRPQRAVTILKRAASKKKIVEIE